MGAADCVGAEDLLGAKDSEGTSDCVGTKDSVGTTDCVGTKDLVGEEDSEGVCVGDRDSLGAGDAEHERRLLEHFDDIAPGILEDIMSDLEWRASPGMASQAKRKRRQQRAKE